MIDLSRDLLIDGRWRAVGLVLLMLVAAPAWPDEWSELTPQQQRVLRNYESHWSNLSDDQRRQLQLGSQRWLSMDEAKRREAMSRFQRWQSLAPDRRELLKRRFEEFRSLTPQQQRRVRDRLEALRRMNPEQRQRLRKRFESLPPDQRAKALERMKQRAGPMGDDRRQSNQPRTATQRMPRQRANTHRLPDRGAPDG